MIFGSVNRLKIIANCSVILALKDVKKTLAQVTKLNAICNRYRNLEFLALILLLAVT